MKRKFYVAALATLALTACNNEDLLVENNPSVKSSVMFNVSLDGDGAGSRATWGGTNGYTLKWLAEDADRMSFFHGATNSSGSITKAQNAIYKAESAGSEGVKFTTHSMINSGLGVMVYPCDTTFNYNGTNLYYKLPDTQTAESNLLIPFMSNVITIAPFDAIKGDGAGYAKEYDIALKQVGTQFTMDADWKGETLAAIKTLSDAGQILPINVVSSELQGHYGFTGEVEIIVTAEVPAYNSKITGRDKWSFVSKAVPSGRYYYNAIKTKAVSGLEISEFTLLPFNNSLSPNGKPASVKINTRYGSVTINDTDGDVWEETNSATDAVWQTVSEGISELQNLTLNKKAVNANSKFAGEFVGGHVTRHISVDLANLNMSDVCITNDKHLHDIILVHDALQEGEDVTFTINGDETGVFEMSMATLNMLKERPEIKIAPCTNVGEACTAIRLTGATEVPVFEFLTTPVSYVYLANEATAWTWTGDNKKIKNVETLVNEGTLNVAAGSELGGASGAYYYALRNVGTMNVNGVVKQNAADTYNYGTINIAVGAEYVAYETTLTNVSYGLDEGEYGKIYNSGILTTSKHANSKINNYAYIENMIGGTANMTYITANESNPAADFAKEYNMSTNKFGTIMLKNADDNISISNSTAVGFIKFKYTETVYDTPEVCKYNYIIVEDHDLTIPEGTHTEVKFLEVKTTGNNIAVIKQQNNHLTALRGFILKGKANVQENNKLVVPAAYIEGNLYVGGLFCKPSQPEILPDTENVYFGDSTVDYLRTY